LLARNTVTISSSPDEPHDDEIGVVLGVLRDESVNGFEIRD
jgi:hypothetical protein